MNALEKIKGLRNQKGISQTKMAEIIGISQTGYAKIESGVTENIALNVAIGIAKALNISFNELFDIDSDSQKAEQLKAENDKLKSELENLQLLVQLLKEKKMITSPRHIPWEGNDISLKGDEFIRHVIEKSKAEDQRIIDEIKNDTRLLELFENGTVTDGSYYHIWKDYIAEK